MSPIGTIARVRRAQDAGLLNEDGTPACPFESARLSPGNSFLIEGEQGKTLYIRLLDGKHAHRLAALREPDLNVVRAQPELLHVA